MAFYMLARHGLAIQQLTRDMAREADEADLVRFLAYDAANFVYAFLLATGNQVTPADRTLRNDVQDAILAVLAKHGIDQSTFVVGPEIDRGLPLPTPN